MVSSRAAVIEEETRRVTRDLWKTGRATLKRRQIIDYEQTYPRLKVVRKAGAGLITELLTGKGMLNSGMLDLKKSSKILVFYPHFSDAVLYISRYWKMPNTPGEVFPGSIGALHYYREKNSFVTGVVHGSAVYDKSNLTADKKWQHKDWSYHLLDELFNRAEVAGIKEVKFSQPLFNLLEFSSKVKDVDKKLAEKRLQKFAEIALKHGFEVRVKKDFINKYSEMEREFEAHKLREV